MACTGPEASELQDCDIPLNRYNELVPNVLRSVLQFGVRDTSYKAGKIGFYGGGARYDDVMVTRQ